MRIILVTALLAAFGCSNTKAPTGNGDMGAGDLAAPPEPGADLAGPPDLLPAGDLAGPADLAPPPPDLSPSCGAVAGQMCCPHMTALPDCEHRDVLTGQIIGCDQDAGVCVRCGSLDLPCCPGDICYGGTQCGKTGKPGICT